MKVYRAYIKQIVENKTHSPAKQREMIVECLQEKHKLKENQIVEKLTDCESIFPSNTSKKPKAIIYWYVDSDSRENLELLKYDYKNTDKVITADYTIPSLNISFTQVYERKHIKQTMFELIMKLHGEGISLRKIASELKNNLGLNICFKTVKNIIDRQEKGIRIQKILDISRSLQNN
tara:strand:+ start:54 stop:584 length:531 start_codon:yes stop_codon:yes gene_type:complete